MEIINNKISATPRSKYIKYSTTSSSSSTGNISIDVSNFVKKKGETSQTVEGSFSVTGDVIAYKTSISDIKLPIASTDALGCIKVGANLTITEDGTLNATGGGGSGKAEWGFITGTLSSQTDLWNELNKKANTSSLNVSNWDSAYNLSHSHSNKTTLDGISSTDVSYWNTAYNNNHTHSNKSYLDNINQNLSTSSNVQHSSLKCTGDVIAYSTGSGDIKLPIASKDALGAIRVGNNLTISSDGTLSALPQGITKVNWGDITGSLSAQTDLWTELGEKALKTELHTHSNKTVLDGITSGNLSNWNSAYSNSHLHSNKSTIDGITSTDVSNWNTAYNNNHTHSNKSTLDTITSTKTANWDASYSQRHSHSNKSVLDGISSSDVSGWDTAYSRSHTHSNKSYLDNINQNLSTTSAVKHSSLTCTGDVIAYSTGTTNAPFKYWKPSVNSSGVLSWTNSTSETTPTSVNIKGPKGDKGDPGKDGVDGATFNGGTITNDLQIKKDVAGLTINGYSTGWQGAYIKIVNRALSNYGYAWQNDVGGSSYGSGDLYWQCSNPSNQGSAQNSPWYRVKFFKGNSGSGTCIGAQGAVTNTSDIRCKHRFNDLTNVLSKLDNIQPFYYTWNDDENKIMCLGLSAQDVKPYFPELVHQLGDNPNILSSEEPILGLDYATLGAIVSIAASKELKQLIDNQQKDINLLKEEINKLKQLINEKTDSVVGEGI